MFENPGGLFKPGIGFLQNQDISELESVLLDVDGNLRIVPYANVLEKFPHKQLSLFCVKYGFYSIPTQETIDFLKEEIGDNVANTIEIGSGNGIYSKELGIRGTDSYMQMIPSIREHYELLQQTPITYGEHVEKIDGIEAVKRYRPHTVLAAWVTHKYNPREHWREGNALGVNEKTILSKAKKYIFIGNEFTHRNKPILSTPHRTIKEKWIVSRAEDQNKNVIWIWDK